MIVYIILKSSQSMSEKLDHFSVLDLNINAINARTVIEEIKDILLAYDLEIVRIRLEQNNTIRILSKYKSKINTNDVIAKISQINNVIEISEIIER